MIEFINIYFYILVRTCFFLLLFKYVENSLMAFDAALRYLIENVDLLKHVETFMRNCFRFYLLIRWLRGGEGNGKIMLK